MIRLYFSLLLCCLFSSSSFADTKTYRLSDFFEGDSIVRLKGKSNSIDISIPLSSVSEVGDGSLRLEVVSSQALIEKRSFMYVRFNNATIGQIAFDPRRPSLISNIEIPQQLWRAGFNRLTLAVSQHYAEMCVDGSAPELWSEVNVYNSTLTLDSTVAVDDFNLDDLAGFFNPGIGGQRDVQLLTVQNSEGSVVDKTLPLVAQALALRNQYQPLSVSHDYIPDMYQLPEVETENPQSFWNESRIDRFENTAWYLGAGKTQQVHVLVGTEKSLSPLLSDAVINEISGPYLKAERTPAFLAADKTWVPASYRLIVSGESVEDVYTAAKALAVMDDVLNPVSSIVVRSQSQMGAEMLQQTPVLQPGERYSFSDLGVGTEQFKDEGSFVKALTVRLPADFYVPENASVQFLLDFAYGAGVGPGSNMNVNVNGELVHGLYLGDENGESFRDYQLKIPARFFKGGINSIEFQPTMRAPLAGVPCSNVFGSHLLFQLNDSSSIELPEAGHVAVQPDLNLFSETAYPFARYSTAPPSSIYISSDEYLDSALTLAGKLGQVAQSPLLNLAITRDANSNKGSLIVLGTPDALSDIDQDSLVSAVGNTKSWPYRAQNMLYNRVRDIANDKSYRKMRTSGVTVQESDLGEQAVLIAERHPNNSATDTLFLLVAQTPELLNSRINDLTSLSLWGQMAGDFFVWDDNLTPLLVMQVSEKFEVGDADNFWLTTRLWLSNNPWYWLISFMLLVFLVSLLIYLLLRRRNKQVQDSW
ncbi:cellulose biosynthesis cyclic di-GMP-binding regulatory protein BcsB [Alteromonas sp. 1_MG-2023]|uniref:cellulose biosynthesis cyclic di-GMP-binding regulatory protein BcsB n=1 Tax=Alteromonas sp. 1_MG-2023 TaxID=3062669 RepID=UPI0026E41635|nr:cellulose biosynthesis cyclic di-GMP-binding regulatory protein BcsB [Alteromonas sp. 1_MG-2023]MDO6568220.1 cellulose biosynthesis cyclic di-GMP-binding regulatory protein BcsB [Alteromonas sp. 1_MG-2023]